MNLLLRLLGYIVIAIGLVLGLLAAFGGFASKQQTDRYIAIGLGVFALILLAIGAKWARPKRKTSWRSDPATNKQREFAKDLGIRFPKNITKGELSELIDE